MQMTIDNSTIKMIEECYFETVTEALDAGHSNLIAHKEGVTGASMLLASLTSMEDETAKHTIVSMNLRPSQRDG